MDRNPPGIHLLVGWIVEEKVFPCINNFNLIQLHNDTILIAILGKNEIFGELGWLQHIPRSATVTAVTDCTLQVIKESEAPLLMEYNPKVLIPVLKIVCSRMGDMLDKMSKNI